METLTLRFPSNPRLLCVVRNTVTAAATAMGFTPHEADSICLAVDEACANIMRHCYGGRCDRTIEMECQLSEDRIDVILRDEGAPFDPAQVAERDLDQLRPGGLGLHLIQQMMDEVTYRPGPVTGTELVLTKFRTAEHGDSHGRADSG